jgi:acetyl esterase
MAQAAPLSEAAWTAILDGQGHDPCPGVAITRDVILSQATATAPRQHAVIWQPEGRPASGAGLVAFHGGGFCAGHPAGCGALAKTLALACGVTTVSVSYRLGSAEAPTYPGVLDDAAAAWRWIHEHAADLAVDPRRLAVSGESAGCFLAGHLAVQSPLVATGLPAPAAMIAQWGPLDFVSRWYDNGENQGAEVNLFGRGGHAVDPARYLRASVLNHAHTGLPPALFQYGRRDPVVHARQGRLGDAAWRAAGAHSELQILDNIGHGVVGDNREVRRIQLAKAAAFAAARWV